LSVRAFLALVCSLLIAGLAPAQEANLFFDTVDVNVVNLEVVVTDKTGLPVSGLTLDDFTILEDGQTVPISNFFAIENGVPAAESLPEDETPVPVGAPGLVGPETQRLQLIIFVDNLTIRPENRNLIFTQLRQFLRERLEPTDQVMIVVADDAVEIAQPFTNEAQLLEAAIDRLEKRVGTQVQFDVEYRTLLRSIQRASLALPGQGGGAGGSLAAESSFDVDTAIAEAASLAREIRTVSERRYRMVLSALGALDRFIDTLAGMRGRKAVLYLSDGLPVNSADSLVEAWTGKYLDWIQTVGEPQLLLEITSLGSLEYDSGTDLSDLISEATVRQVAFYPISSFARGGVMGISAEYGDSGTVSGGAGLRAAADLEAMNRESTLLSLAEGTGGVAFTRSTNITDLLNQVRQDFSTFYSLGFQSPPEANECRCEARA
jgi:VWFA-related protein